MATKTQTKPKAKAKAKANTKKPARKAAKTATPKKKRLTKAQQLAREIARRNRVFQAATPAEKRVLIAQDVINQIKAKRYYAREGTWVYLNNSNGSPLCPVTQFGENASIREAFLDKKVADCDCCALGALFMSCTLYNNQTTAAQFDRELAFDFDGLIETPGALSNGLNQFFSVPQLKLIEAAFERNDGAFRAPDATVGKIEAWYDRYAEDDNARLIAIMENIIKNNGTFKP